ncbi:MAG: hypothetical protein U5L11_02910 [Arhodomonas sp.]|nr:hypothetical protein [Arhodomonas sp.]
MFSVVMGMAGLTLAWQSAPAHAAGLPALVADTLRPLVGVLFLVISVFYAAKLVRYPASVIGELQHPVKLSFFPTISISLILLGTLALAGPAPVSALAAPGHRQSCPIWSRTLDADEQLAASLSTLSIDDMKLGRASRTGGGQHPHPHRRCPTGTGRGVLVLLQRRAAVLDRAD